MIQTTSWCNAGCIFCPYPDVKDKLPSGEMDAGLFRKIVDECAGYPVERIMPYLMNEPMLDICIEEKIGYIKKKSPKSSVHILTNGSQLDAKRALSLIRSGVDWVGFSVHGLRPETIEAAMHIPGKRLLENIRRFIELSKSENKSISDFIMITFLGHDKLSVDEKKEAFRFWQESGIERISYFEKPISRAGNVRAISGVHNEAISGCNSIWANDMIHILFNGDVVLCCMDWRREHVLGNVAEDSILQIWNSNKYEHSRKMVSGSVSSPPDFLCKRCEEARNPSAEAAVPEKRRMTLIFAPPWDIDMPPLGIAYLAAYIKREGHKTDILDLNIELYNRVPAKHRDLWNMNSYSIWSAPESFGSVLDILEKSSEDIINDLAADDSRILGFSVHGANLLFSIWLARKIKEKNKSIKIIFGGPACFHFEKDRPLPSGLYDHNTGQALIYPGLVDAFVYGEGEQTLSELIDRVSASEGWGEEIRGIVGYTQGEYRRSAPREPIKDLDILPAPDFEGFPIGRYASKRIPLLMSRGCVRRCSFCNDWRISGQMYRTRSADHMKNEICAHVEKYRARHFHFCDLLINGDIRELERFCNILSSSCPDISWTAQASIHRSMREDLLVAMKRAGCVCLVYGVESFSDRVLKKMNKPYTQEDIREILMNTNKSGIEVWINFIVGFPGETDDDVSESIEFIKNHHSHIKRVSSLSPCYVTGNSELEMFPEKYGLVLPEHDWWFLWEDDKGSTYKKRREKTLVFKKLFESLDIPVEFTGLYDIKKESPWKRLLPKIFC